MLERGRHAVRTGRSWIDSGRGENDNFRKVPMASFQPLTTECEEGRRENDLTAGGCCPLMPIGMGDHAKNLPFGVNP